MKRLLFTVCVCAAMLGCNKGTYWHIDENLPLFGAVTAHLGGCKHFKWHNNEDKGRGFEYSVRCTLDGKTWKQYEVVPASDSVTTSPSDTVDPHPEEAQTISLYDADTAYKLSQNKPKNTVTAPESEHAEDLKKTIRLMANLNGLLCAEVKAVRPLQQHDIYEVTCVVYRGGTATKAYAFDIGRGVMWEI